MSKITSGIGDAATDVKEELDGAGGFSGGNPDFRPARSRVLRNRDFGR